tara:strand:- start:143 stop:304 length:162 start_codon:yes stop_codon:yes gene_type:complete
MQMAKFLNDFEKGTKYKLACVSEKMAKLERTIEFWEASMRGASDPSNIRDSVG